MADQKKKLQGQMTALTRAKRRLRSEVEEIASFVQMDVVWNFERYADLTTSLKIMRDKLVRGHIIAQYTFIDEYLAMIICNYYFYRPKKKNVWYRELWKTKRFRVFMHHLMDEMFVLKKLSVVEAIKDVPTDVSNAIKRINDVRNAIAHTLFPEQRRRYMKEKKVTYRGSDVFSMEGLQKFREDCAVAQVWLHKKAFGREM
jgi:hypothetical protein